MIYKLFRISDLEFRIYELNELLWHPTPLLVQDATIKSLVVYW